MKSQLATCLAALMLAAGCASTPPPTERMTTAQANVKASKMLGAPNVPRADLHLRMAEQEVAKAQTLIKEGENDMADLMLQRANADAELSLALTREAAAANMLVDEAEVEDEAEEEMVP